MEGLLCHSTCPPNRKDVGCGLGKQLTSAWSRNCAGDRNGRRKGEKTYPATLTEPTLKEGVEGHRVLLTTGQTAV